MNNIKGYEINFENKVIVITKKFNKAAGIYGSDEYSVLNGLRKDFSDFAIRIKTIEKKPNKVSYKGLSVDEMRRFINANRSAEEQDLFNKVIELQEGNKGKYAVIKKWFLDRYKDIYTTAIEELSKEQLSA